MSSSSCLAKRFTVQGLPYRRTLNELGASPFVQCLAPYQLKALARWCRTAAVGDELEQGWATEEGGHAAVAVRRVA